MGLASGRSSNLVQTTTKTGNGIPPESVFSAPLHLEADSSAVSNSETAVVLAVELDNLTTKIMVQRCVISSLVRALSDCLLNHSRGNKSNSTNSHNSYNKQINAFINANSLQSKTNTQRWCSIDAEPTRFVTLVGVSNLQIRSIQPCRGNHCSSLSRMCPCSRETHTYRPPTRSTRAISCRGQEVARAGPVRVRH